MTQGVDIKRLRDAMSWSRQKLRPFRMGRIERLRQLVGVHYSDYGSEERVPVNLMELALNIYQTFLAGQAPNVLASTPHEQLKLRSIKLELALNHWIEEAKFGETMADVVLDALLSIGILKLGLNDKSHQVTIGGKAYSYAMPFADHVSVDNWIHDMTARRFDQVQFCGDRYTMDYDEAMELFRKAKGRDFLQPDDNSALTNEGEETAAALSRGGDTAWDQYRQTVNLWDIWLPKENLIVTLDDSGNLPEDMALEVKERESGDERGPYRVLTFQKLPDNIMPLAPASQWEDINDLTNKLYVKLGRQAVKQRTILGVQASNMEDGQRIADAEDQQTVPLVNPKATQEYRFGGVDGPTLAFLIQSKDLYSYLAGNLDALGGLSPQADTLGQEQLLSASASQRVMKMRGRVEAFTQDAITSVGELLWTDPLYELPLVKKLPRANLAIPMTWTPDDREGEFFRYNVKLEPYSMQLQSPGQKLRALQDIFMQFVAPYIPMMQQQGILIDFEALFNSISRYTALTDLREFMIYTNPQHPQQGPVVGGGVGGGQGAAGGVRTNVRINRPGATSQGKDAEMIKMLLGGGSQPAEQAQLTRSVG